MVDLCSWVPPACQGAAAAEAAGACARRPGPEGAKVATCGLFGFVDMGRRPRCRAGAGGALACGGSGYLDRRLGPAEGNGPGARSPPLYGRNRDVARCLALASWS